MFPDWNDPVAGRALIDRITALAPDAGPLRIMEVCGTHTMAIGRCGIRRLLPETIRLISGPGCPVCVTPAAYIDNAVAAAHEREAIIATFGDMVRVPGLATSLEKARAEGAAVRIMTSPLDVLRMDGPVLCLAVGFETTIAPLAAAMQAVRAAGRDDIKFYTCLKVVPPTLALLAADRAIGIDAFLLPGHVSAVIGADAYRFLDLPSVIAGFEMLDILEAVRRILEMKSAGRTAVENCYGRVVTPQGNLKAQELIRTMLEPCDQPWRGLGVLPGCSLRLREQYASIDAERAWGVPAPDAAAMPGGCACGAVLKGQIIPPECPLFGEACTPDTAVGPCMVSSEGSCASYYKYERKEE